MRTAEDGPAKMPVGELDSERLRNPVKEGKWDRESRAVPGLNASRCPRLVAVLHRRVIEAIDSLPARVGRFRHGLRLAGGTMPFRRR